MTGVRIICVAGAESTGKSWLVARLADHFACPAVPEYGRDYCLVHGNDIGMDELVHIGREQQRMIAVARAEAAVMGAPFVFADTDAIVTAIWADMMYGARDAWFGGPLTVADLYLVMANDIPWQRDAIRFYGRDEERERLRGLLVAEIERRSGRWLPVSGEGPDRIASAIAAISATFPTAASAANGAR